MNKQQIEQLLQQEGFTPKEISVILQHAEKDAYPWLLSQLFKKICCFHYPAAHTFRRLYLHIKP